ncbi:hypothetical protein CLU97_3570 [Chryseobacterium sp. 7]|uniref:hypothetical protein n=1 Tax=Chryseobacterium sp. 7 TaxID=2035214 RepID=UPI000EB4F9D4|nr:hypothetical protein [Chryseobacterium sp. 7]RLJ34077.1 hypothetical protein CLU97_3570 [Chryseobacterium sp. 7]
MLITIKIKNKTNWAVTIVLGLGLLMLSFIILIIIPLTSLQEQGFYAVLNFFSSVTPFAAFFILFLYFWLWNTFGKTILIIEPEQITVRYKNKLFTKPKIYLKKEIEQIMVKDFKVEKSKLGVRYRWVNLFCCVYTKRKRNKNCRLDHRSQSQRNSGRNKKIGYYNA